MSNRLAGLLEVQLNGSLLQAKGSWTYNLGANKREAIVGADRVHGFKEMPQAPHIEGEITDASDFDVASLLKTDDATITLKLANGKTIVLRNAWFCDEGNIGTEEASIKVKFEGKSAEEIRA